VKPVVIFEGSFNPIHNGHLIIIQMISEIIDFERFFIVPAKISPFKKEDSEVIPFEKRFEWVKSAAGGIDGIEVSDIEGKTVSRVSYTIDTVKAFRKKFSNPLMLTVGGDSFESFDKWKDWKEILNECTLLVYPRKREENFFEKKEIAEEKTIFLKVPLIEISSSQIRSRIKRRLSIRGFVPQMLEAEIEESYKNYFGL